MQPLTHNLKIQISAALNWGNLNWYLAWQKTVISVVLLSKCLLFDSERWIYLWASASMCSKYDSVQCLWDVAVFHALSAQPSIAPALSLPNLKLSSGVNLKDRAPIPPPLFSINVSPPDSVALALPFNVHVHSLTPSPSLLSLFLQGPCRPFPWPGSRTVAK